MLTPDLILSSSVDTIAHSAQKYETVGDYVFCDRQGTHLKISVSNMGDWRFGFVCGIHEQIEAALLVTYKIDEAQVREFDEDYEKARQEVLTLGVHERPGGAYRIKWGCRCEIDEETEPGADVHAPYHREHMFADGIERLVLRELGGSWGDYEEAVANLEYRPHDPFKENGEASEDVDNAT